MPAGIYIPKTTEGAKLEAAKKFLAFAASKEAATRRPRRTPPSGPYVVKGCTLPDDVPAAVKDLQPYVDDRATTSPALEFLSPIKGPALEQITVEVGSGITNAPQTARRCTTRTSRSRLSSSGLPGWS